MKIGQQVLIIKGSNAGIFAIITGQNDDLGEAYSLEDSQGNKIWNGEFTNFPTSFLADPSKKSIQVNNRLSPSLVAAISKRAAATGLNFRQTIESILKDVLSEELDSIKERKEVLQA